LSQSLLNSNKPEENSKIVNSGKYQRQEKLKEKDQIEPT